MESIGEFISKYQVELFFVFILVCLFGWSLVRKLMGCMLILIMLVIGLAVGGYYFMFSENGSKMSSQAEEWVKDLKIDKVTKEGAKDLLDYLTSQLDEEKVQVEEIIDLANHMKHKTQEREAFVKLLVRQKESGYFE